MSEVEIILIGITSLILLTLTKCGKNQTKKIRSLMKKYSRNYGKIIKRKRSIRKIYLGTVNGNLVKEKDKALKEFGFISCMETIQMHLVCKMNRKNCVTFSYACRNIVNTIRTSGHSSLKKYTYHFIRKGYERVYVWEVSWRLNKDCNILTPTLLAIAAFLSRSARLLNRGPGGQAYAGSGSHSSNWNTDFKLWSPTDLNFLSHRVI